MKHRSMQVKASVNLSSTPFRLGKRVDQLQAAAHPADIASALAGEFVLRHAEGADELAQQQRLFDSGKGAPLGTRQRQDHGGCQIT
jgi:hypothetical protein